MSTIDALAQIIAAGVKDLQAQCAARGASYPTADVLPSPETDKVQTDLAAQAAPVIAAASQLVALLQHPQPYLIGTAFQSGFSGALAVVEAAFVPDILREAGRKGLHVKDIAVVRNVDPGKLGRALRALATRHIFEEVTPDVFRNNRISAQLCTGKPVKEMLASPSDRWAGTNGCAALVSLNGTENTRAAGCLAENLLDPRTAFSQEPTEAAFQLALGTKLTHFDWLDLPENAEKLKKFGVAMGATTNYNDGKVATQGFEWAALPQGSVVVDVGGGVGNLTMALAKVHKHLRYIVQDRPGTIETAHGIWKLKMPGHVENGSVQLQGHSFFDEQPVKDAAVFLTRYTTHNWSDKYAVKYLRRLRDAARPDTKLVVMDYIQDYMCRTVPDIAQEIPGALKPTAPEPLLPYPDTATGWNYGMDLCMMGFANCQERTLGAFVDLFKKAGWKLDKVHRLESPLPSQLVCSPL